jgi:hypothetical protein
VIPGTKLVMLSYDILRGVNSTIWGGVEGVEKTSTIIKSGLSLADITVGVSNGLEDLACGDTVCCALDIIASVSTSVGLVLGNIPNTKHLTTITGSITLGCRSVRYYCKNYGTYWGCTVLAAEGIKETVKFTVNSIK